MKKNKFIKLVIMTTCVMVCTGCTGLGCKQYKEYERELEERYDDINREY